MSIFIIGSNRDLLSWELATLFFTFEEVCKFKKVNKNNRFVLEDIFNDFLLWSGLSQCFMLENIEQNQNLFIGCLWFDFIYNN